MTDLEVSIPQTMTHSLQNSISDSGLEQDQLVASRTFVDKIVQEILSVQKQCGSDPEILQLVNRIKATQEALENLHQTGSSSCEEKLIQVVTIGQKLLSWHKEVCLSAIKRAFSPE